MKHLFKYVKEIINYDLFFDKNELSLKSRVFTDSDFARSLVDRKFVSEYLIIINEVVVLYVSRKQVSVAISITKTEYVTLAVIT